MGGEGGGREENEGDRKGLGRSQKAGNNAPGLTSSLGDDLPKGWSGMKEEEPSTAVSLDEETNGHGGDKITAP